jgi:hypothetical protein
MADLTMKVDRDEVWSEGTPPGTFEVNETRLQDRPAVTAKIFFVCPNAKRCGVFLGPKFEDRPSEDEPCVWGWDGNSESPTVTPSINCISEKNGKPTGGCGWHGFITAGRMTNA